MEIKAELVKELREQTGAGIMECKSALVETEGDLEKAKRVLNARGLVKASKKAHRETREGLIGQYVHAGGKIGVLIEVNCETDFVARNESFHQLVKDLAMQIAAAEPVYVKREDVSEETLEKEKKRCIEELSLQKGSEEVTDEMLNEMIERFYGETCLLEQPFIKGDQVPVKEHISSFIATLGENITVRRFVRYQVGSS